jgi:Aldehyde dehydrogenase family
MSVGSGCVGGFNRAFAMTQLDPEVSRFLSAPPQKMFIGGKWVEAKGGKTFETRDPGEGKVLANVAAGDGPDVEAAVAAAREAFQKSGWATMPVNDRAVILHRLADRANRIAGCRQAARPGRRVRRAALGADVSLLCRPGGAHATARADCGFRL